MSTAALSEEERKVCWAWASWTAEEIRGWLELHDVDRVDDEGFVSCLTEVLSDIAQANAKRTVAPPLASDPKGGE